MERTLETMPDFLAERAHIENECRDRGWSASRLSRDACRIDIPALAATGVPGPHLILSQPDDPRYKIQIRFRGRSGLPENKGPRLSAPGITDPLQKDWKNTFRQAAGWIENYIAGLAGPDAAPGRTDMPAWMAEARAALFPAGK